MHVPPWAIDDDDLVPPYAWHLRTLALMRAEAEAEAYHRKQAQRKRR